MMSETYYPMNHVPWGCASNPSMPVVVYIDKETQFSGVLEDRSTSMADLRAARSGVIDRSGDSGFGEHAPLAPPSSAASSSGDALRESCVTEDASQGRGQLTSGAIYSEVGSSSSPDRERFCLEDEIVHLAEEPLTGELDGVVTSQDDVRRLDRVDGPRGVATTDNPEDSCAVDCLYYTLKCCDCRII
ncbi:hypothetical protein PR048_016273 [Dryococelus australis]|uniref:Uncharacterized protein n=1 Tax=Dryococelus australis TaxID=614101 RepID=A0ABQ9HJ98_9NEOP|nr:hypothetical protein PR048_016273 [Dryococelus australis]